MRGESKLFDYVNSLRPVLACGARCLSGWEPPPWGRLGNNSIYPPSKRQRVDTEPSTVDLTQTDNVQSDNAPDYETWTQKQLQDRCAEFGLKTSSGVKVM
eukprot:SAG31_NODE_14837_length_785_cov_1.097668_1_plen_99_part_10